MGYLRLGVIPGGGNHDCIVKSNVLHVNMNSNKDWIDLVYEFTATSAQAQGQIRLSASTNFTAETVEILNNAVITAETKGVAVDVQLPAGQSISNIIINPAP